METNYSDSHKPCSDTQVRQRGCHTKFLSESIIYTCKSSPPRTQSHSRKVPNSREIFKRNIAFFFINYITRSATHFGSVPHIAAASPCELRYPNP